MYYDLIIVTQSTPALIPITQQCIDTARLDGADLNIIIVETGSPYKYDVDKIIEYNGEFNYNRALNLGLKYVKGDIHILANNDIIFHKGWSRIGELMKLNDYHSASAVAWHQKEYERGDFVYEGYNVGYLLNGWCIFLDKYCLEKIGRLDESVSFWYSDDLYALQLKQAGIPHGLFTGVQVDHIASKTILKQSSRIQRQYQSGELPKYLKRKRDYATGKTMYQINSQHLQA